VRSCLKDKQSDSIGLSHIDSPSNHPKRIKNDEPCHPEINYRHHFFWEVIYPERAAIFHGLQNTAKKLLKYIEK